MFFISIIFTVITMRLCCIGMPCFKKTFRKEITINDLLNSFIFKPSKCVVENILDVDYIEKYIVNFKDISKYNENNIGDIIYIINSYKIYDSSREKSIYRIYSILLDEFVEYITQNKFPSDLNDKSVEYLKIILDMK